MIVTVDMPKLNPTYLSDLKGRSNFPDQYKTEDMKLTIRKEKKKKKKRKKLLNKLQGFIY